MIKSSPRIVFSDNEWSKRHEDLFQYIDKMTRREHQFSHTEMWPRRSGKTFFINRFYELWNAGDLPTHMLNLRPLVVAHNRSSVRDYREMYHAGDAHLFTDSSTHSLRGKSLDSRLVFVEFVMIPGRERYIDTVNEAIYMSNSSLVILS